MAQEFALNRLLEIASTQADTAAAALGDLNRTLRQHEEKLLLLHKYRDDYQQRLRVATTSGLDGAGLRNFHQFLDRLEQAIHQQNALVVEARTRAERGLGEWRLKQRKSKAYDTLSQRFHTVRRRGEAVREQKTQDDFAARASRSNSDSRR